MGKRIMLVEDDDVIRENFSDILADEGFEVNAFGNQHDAIAYCSMILPDVVLLDIRLNDEREGGFQLCMELRRQFPRLPIIFFTSCNNEVDKISGLRLGADDYLTKDIGIDYLIVRIEALLRRIETLTNKRSKSDRDSPKDVVRGFLVIDQARLIAYWKGQPVDLTLTQFWIIQELARDSGQVKNYTQLMKTANICVEPNTITAHIKTIRDRFKSIDNEFNCIKTERGIGYRWVDV
jgi:two-component system OmpR family response regulator